MQIHNNPACLIQIGTSNEIPRPSLLPLPSPSPLSLSPRRSRRVLISPHGAFKTKHPLETSGESIDSMGVHVRFLWNVRILLFASDTVEREPFCSGESKFPGKLVSSVRRSALDGEE